jgi:uncharacterized protein DUF1360
VDSNDTGTLTRPRIVRRSPFEGYSSEERPMGGYAVLTGTFFAGVGAAVLAARARGVRPPERIGAADLVTIGLATHKLSRAITKDKVTATIRAPFTEFQRESGQGEVEERPRGSGLRRAIGELLVCPYCLAQWVSAGFIGGLVFAPRATRLVAAVYTAETVSDFLQLAYHAAEERA